MRSASDMSARFSNLEKYYNIVYDQSISSSGNHLATCDDYGQIAVFNYPSILSVSSEKNDRIPTRTLKGHKGPIYCLERAKELLVSGGRDGVKVWKWDHLLKTSKEVQPVTTFQPPSSRCDTPDINSMAYDQQTETLYCGCGDNSIHAWDIKTSKLKGSFTGHTGYVHCVCMRNGSNQFLSGAEDATVRIWDPAVPKSLVQVLKPTKQSNGQWVGCVAVDTSGDWVVCAGSMGPTFFHLSSPSSATKTATMELPAGATTYAVIFVKDRIITAGSGSGLRHWTINGEALSCVPSNLKHVFSLAYNENNKKHEVLTASGDSSDVSVFTNLGYTAFSLSVIPPPLTNQVSQ